jgi:hypothetical protein
LGNGTDSTGLIIGLSLAGASLFAVALSFKIAGFCSSVLPRPRSMIPLHRIGKTISPEAVIPIGIQPPGGTSSVTEGFDGLEFGFNVPVV